LDGSSAVATREWEYKETLLLDFITSKTFNYKTSRTRLFEGEYYEMTLRGAYTGLNVYVMR
jgi:hypothetical protein